MKVFKNKRFRVLLSLLFTIIVAFLLYRIVDFEYFIENIQVVSPQWLILASLSLMLSYLFRVWRYQIVLNCNKLSILFSISTLHYLFNRVLPARTGEISLPILFNKHLGYSYQKGIGALLLFRLFDFWAMILLFLISMLFVKNVDINASFLLGVAMIGLLILASLWFFIGFYSSILLKILSIVRIKRTDAIKNKIIGFVNQVKTYRTQRGLLFFLKIVTSSVLSWICIYFYYYFIIHAFHFDIAFFDTLFASTIPNFTFILPISAVGNIGTFEAGWALGFFIIGMSKDISIPIGLFSNLFATIITAFLALVGYIMLKLKTKVINENH